MLTIQLIMPGLALPAYLLYIYIVLPVVLKSLTTLYSKRYEICPLVKCIVPLASCIREPSCRRWLEEVGECSDPDSSARRQAAQTYAHVQHPKDPAYCQYLSFDRVQNTASLAFLECLGQSGCLAPATNSDTCANLSNISVLPFSIIEPHNLQGTWKKLYTSGWDLWPCQWTEFWPPRQLAAVSERELPSPDSWMTQWPNATNVWRMDLFWKTPEPSNMTFHMCNEMYPLYTWEFVGGAKPQPTTAATLRTRAVMWGTEAHENWYLLHYDSDWQTMLVYYCAYTKAVERFDSCAFVLQKVSAPSITDEQSQFYKVLATQLLGNLHGNLQRVAPCQAG